MQRDGSELLHHLQNSQSNVRRYPINQKPPRLTYRTEAPCLKSHPTLTVLVGSSNVRRSLKVVADATVLLSLPSLRTESSFEHDFLLCERFGLRQSCSSMWTIFVVTFYAFICERVRNLRSRNQFFGGRIYNFLVSWTRFWPTRRLNAFNVLIYFKDSREPLVLRVRTQQYIFLITSVSLLSVRGSYLIYRLSERSKDSKELHLMKPTQPNSLHLNRKQATVRKLGCTNPPRNRWGLQGERRKLEHQLQVPSTAHAAEGVQRDIRIDFAPATIMIYYPRAPNMVSEIGGRTEVVDRHALRLWKRRKIARKNGRQETIGEPTRISLDNTLFWAYFSLSADWPTAICSTSLRPHREEIVLRNYGRVSWTVPTLQSLRTFRVV